MSDNLSINFNFSEFCMKLSNIEYKETYKINNNHYRDIFNYNNKEFMIDEILPSIFNCFGKPKTYIEFILNLPNEDADILLQKCITFKTECEMFNNICIEKIKNPYSDYDNPRYSIQFTNESNKKDELIEELFMYYLLWKNEETPFF